MMNRLILTTLALCLSFTALAGKPDAAAGAAKAEQMCASCHSKNGDKPIMPAYPKLAGQYADYLEQALKDYKSGKRKNPIMAGMAAGLSEEDIRNLAAWYASQTPSVGVLHK